LAGVSADLVAVKYIPVIGGLSIAGGTAAGRLIGNSILKGAVTNAVSFSLDMGELGVLRALFDDRVTFGDAVMDIPKEMMVAALLGGGFGALGGALAARSPGKKGALSAEGNIPFHRQPLSIRVAEQVEEGAKIPNSPALGNDSYGSVEDYQAIVAKQMKAMDDRMATHGIPPLGEDARTFVQVVGGIGVTSATEKSSVMALSRLATDRLTRAFNNPSGTVSSLAGLLHDNHLLSLGGEEGPLPLDVAVRTATNSHKGTVAKIVEETYQKISKDRSLPPLTRDEVRKMVGQVHLNGGVVPDGVSPQLGSIIGEAYGRLKP
jgi:hypothetical protein